MKYRLLAMLVSVALPAMAQRSYYLGYSWDNAPKVYAPSESDKASDVLLVKDCRIQEVSYDKDGQAVILETIHRRYHVNTVKGVDVVNKGFIPLRNVIEEVDLKARCITPSGRILPFNTASVKSVDNFQGSGPYKIFAIDGVEPGCDVEIMFTNKKNFMAYSYIYAQGGIPVKQYESRIISPKNLVFETRSYNGLASFQQEESDTSRNHLYLLHKDLPAAADEKYSAGKGNNMAYICQLSVNTSRKNSRIYTWDIISREIYDSYFIIKKEETKAVAKALKAAKIDGGSPAADKIAALDNLVKTGYEIDDDYETLTLEKAIESRRFSEAHAVRFYVAALKALGVPFELGVTCDRTDMRLDPKFPSYIYTREFIIYYPGEETYVTPVSINSRPGFPNLYVLNNHALFIKEVSVGEVSTSSARTRLIAAPEHTASYHNLELKADLDFEKGEVKLDAKQLLNGYSAYFVQPIYRYLNTEQKKDVHERYYLTEKKDAVKTVRVENTEAPDIYRKPMVIAFQALQNEFLEKAGNRYLFNVGQLIGTQEELYQESKRTTPADMYYPHYLKRDLVIKIPPGYRISNPGEVEINKVCTIEGKETAVFRSAYKMENNTMVITIYEDYRLVEYPPEAYEALKAVINAAADFNKKKLIFEKS